MMHFGSTEPIWCMGNINSFRKMDAQIKIRWSPSAIGAVSRDRDIFRQEAHHLFYVSQRPEAAAHLTRAEVDAFTHQLSEARETSEYFNDLRERNSKKIVELLPNEIEQ